MGRLSYAALTAVWLLGLPRIVALEPVQSPPAVQMHVPGFEVRQLPVELPNINNVLYREDGVLVALAYDGDVYLLQDTDGDGLEDDAQLFWKSEGRLRAPVGMALTPPGYAHGRGVFVPSKTKCSLIVDTDGDDVADEEKVIAEGWPELWTQVDALGVAVDPKDHAVYFGLGTWNFADGYQKDKDGVAQYRLDDEHGTILRVAPDFSSREIVCTGVRFPVALRFNKDGELFCTDQEGATWLPNGNPFDELLHIERGRHYGFPPRHPRHLTGVIDEPSVFDYRPQHQSTCGLNFNDPLVVDGSIFGPAWWQSDAIVTGFSRGKLYRTKLVRANAGYVAQNQLIASTTMMPSDACLAPGGSLVIATHSGGPDWGTGPAGRGKLFKVTYQKDGPAIPSLVWAASPSEVRIAFDRPVSPDAVRGLAEKTVLEAGEFVAAADRFESFRPGYAVVRQQRMAPRRAVEVQDVHLAEDGRTLIVTTSPQTTAVTYSITLPGLAPAAKNAATDSTPQAPDIDLQYDLCGVEATWEGDDGSSWQGWLPTFDTHVAHELTSQSAEHQQLWKQVRGAGTLTLRAAVDLKDMLHPALQPGTTIDFQPAKEEVSLGVNAEWPARILLDGKPGQALINAGYGDSFSIVKGDENSRLLEIGIRKGVSSNIPTVSLHYGTNEDSRPRAMPLRRMLWPWSRPEPPAAVVDNRDLPELKGGDWLRGEKEFYGSEAGCSKCHMMRGVGGEIGPDLSHLSQRDYASVLRDVTDPSFAINPDFTSQMVLLKEGRVLAGTVRTVDERVIVADQEGKETIVPLADVESMEYSPQSIMPEGIPKALGEARLRDLMTFLLVAPAEERSGP